MFSSVKGIFKRKKDPSSKKSKTIATQTSVPKDHDCDMGNCTCAQTGEKKAKEKVLAHQVSKDFQYQFEQDILDNTIMKSGRVVKAALVDLEDHALKAWSPPDFIPEKQGICDICEAFGGDVSGLAERGINVGCDVNPAVPGKMDENKALYGNDGKRGGTSAFKTKKSVLIIVFKENPTLANRLGREAADYMEEHDH